MAYSVHITARARRDVQAAHRYLRKEVGDGADDWLRGVSFAAESLRTMPERCAHAPENGRSRYELRQLLHQSHRILFTIAGQEVRILHVRHTARGPWKP